MESKAREASSLATRRQDSGDLINNVSGGLVGIVPFTSARDRPRSHIELAEGVTGLDHVSFARCAQLRLISFNRIAGQRGYVPMEKVAEIDRAIRFVLDLSQRVASRTGANVATFEVGL